MEVALLLRLDGEVKVREAAVVSLLERMSVRGVAELERVGRIPH